MPSFFSLVMSLTTLTTGLLCLGCSCPNLPNSWSTHSVVIHSLLTLVMTYLSVLLSHSCEAFCCIQNFLYALYIYMAVFLVPHPSLSSSAYLFFLLAYWLPIGPLQATFMSDFGGFFDLANINDCLIYHLALCFMLLFFNPCDFLLKI
jgi:hypothetical protein